MHLTEQELAAGVRLACCTTLHGDAVISLKQQARASILSGGEMADFSPCPTDSGYGIAVDIGTTTVVSYLYAFGSKQPLHTVSRRNSQARFGADVISRIGYCNEHGVSEPKEAIVSQLNDSFSELCRMQGIAVTEIQRAVITGNTTMLHLLCGLDPRGIAAAPFTPQSLFGAFYSPPAIGLHLAESCQLYLPRAVSSYVGADITCALVASGILQGQEHSLLVDIGTNGEMALYANGMLKCCSTAAGPAFEGAGLKMGMPAMEGAVNKVWEENDTLRYTTIGEKPPTGICGSGIIDAVAAFVRCGLIDETGRIVSQSRAYAACICNDEEPAVLIGSSGVVVTQGDIRKIQLAKAAVCAGIDTLLHACNTTAEQIDTLYLAGGFGSFINQQSAADMGLIPKAFANRVKVIGNAAGSGAAMCLLSAAQRTKSEEIAAMAEDIALSGSSYFTDRYIDRMMFETE